MGAVDANLLVRLLAEDDPVQTKRAAAFLETHQPVWISMVVLVETVWVLTAVIFGQRPRLWPCCALPSIAGILLFNRRRRCEQQPISYASSKADFSDCLALELARAGAHLPFATLIKPWQSCLTLLLHSLEDSFYRELLKIDPIE